jgi:hypothetical protein
MVNLWKTEEDFDIARFPIWGSKTQWINPHAEGYLSMECGVTNAWYKSSSTVFWERPLTTSVADGACIHNLHNIQQPQKEKKEVGS